MATAEIHLDNLSKRYGRVVALDHVSLRTDPGEFVTILGPSGSGKTTLLNLIAGFQSPSTGHIRVGHDDITNLPTHKRNLGMVFQNYALFPHMSVAENVAYPLKVRGVGRADREAAARVALETVRMGGFEDRHITAMSGGQRQRVALARAIVFEPGILLMDEPLSALDKALREEMQDELRRLHRRLEMTILCVTHDQDEALALSDRIAVIGHGRLQQFGTPRELYERPENAFVAGFIGRSVRVSPALVTDTPLAAGPTDRLVLRDETLRWARPMDPHGRVTARIEDVTYLGGRSRVALVLADGTPAIALHDGTSGIPTPEPGMQADLYLAHKDAILVEDDSAATGAAA